MRGIPRLSKPKRMLGLAVALIAFVGYGVKEVTGIDIYNIFEDEGETYRVVKVVDGDTIKVKGQEGHIKVRLIGVDTPESVHNDYRKNVPEGKIASKYAKQRLLAKEVVIKYDKEKFDKYGRHLGYVYLEGKMFNRELLEKGYAKVMMFKPNTRCEEEFRALEQEAQQDERGFWDKGKCYYQAGRARSPARQTDSQTDGQKKVTKNQVTQVN